MKKRIFLDTNILLDLLARREPFYDSAAKVATLGDRGDIELVVSALSYSTTFYILSKFENSSKVKSLLQRFKTISIIADLTDKVIEQSLASEFDDFEDALQYYSALALSSDVILTRNEKDFKISDLPVMNAEEYLESIKK